MKSVFLVCVFLGVLQVVYMRIELEDFYPYGPENGDTAVPTNDDGSSGLVNIAFPFPFFDVEHKSLFVNTNGVISFLVEVSQYTPDSFPLDNNRRLIAPFWADVDTREGGVVYYRETLDLAIRTRVSEKIRKYFVRQRRFTAKWVMIVTWLNVARYGGNASLLNTFQTILVTDGLYSFSIFYYNKVEWTFGTESSGIPAQAGFNAGDGIRYFNTPNSRTPAIINITSTSNYKDPGFWIFQVDGETVKNRDCKSKRGLVLSPRSGIELGGTEIFIGGPCYSLKSEIVCRFNKTLVTSGVYVNPEIAYCITPPLYVAGRIQVELSLDGGKTFNYNGTFRSIPLGRNAPDVKGLEVDDWANSTKTVLTWDQNLINASHVDVHISLFDTFQFRIHKASLASFKRVLNSGKYLLDFGEKNIAPRRDPKRKSNTESPIAIVSIKPSEDRVKRNSPQSSINSTLELYSAGFIVPWLVLNSISCQDWWTFQRVEQIAKLRGELSPCPTSFKQISADNEFVPDSGVKRLLNQFHNLGSTSCFRSRSPSASGAGQQCCYNGDSLIVGPPGGGTLDVVSPEKSFWGHMGRDVLPWFACCKLTNNCGRYYERRPSDRGLRYKPPQVADTRGDPHFSTFDGTFYTFNGFGEYILLQLNNGVDLEFQGRMTPLVDDQGRRTNATALTAMVMRGRESDIVQVEFNSRRKIDVFVNRERVEFDEQTRLDFTGIFAVRENKSKISIYFTSGVSVVVKVVENFLTYQISIPTKFKGRTAGLLGFWDDSKDQEFLLPGGSFIQTNSSYRSLHHEFGQKWMVDRNKTLFTYRFGKSYDSFRDLDFTPVFLDDTSSLFSNSTFEQEARNICGENKECLFDIAVTGKTSIGEATLELINELEEKTNNSKVVAKPIFFGCDGVQDSEMKTDFCGVCGGDNSTCVDCEGNVNPGFVNNGTCAFYYPWSEWTACSQAGDDEIKARNRTCSKKGKCEHLGENVEYQKCLCVNCDNDDEDDDSKTLKLYSLSIGLPLFVFLSVVVILMWCFRLRRAKRNNDSKNHSTTYHNNGAYMS